MDCWADENAEPIKQVKARALEHWQVYGGDPAKFEQAWPEICNQILKQKVVTAVEHDWPSRGGQDLVLWPRNDE